MRKHYMSRSQTRSMSADYPIGDPTGGAAYGEFNDPVTAAIMVGGQVVSGLIGADAASSAADAQLQGSREAAAVQREMFNKTLEVQAPYRGAGYQALNTLRSMMPGSYVAYDENGKPVGAGTQPINQMAYTGGHQYVPDIKFQWGDVMHGGSSYTSGDSAADAWVKQRNPSIIGDGLTIQQREQKTRDLYNQYYNGTGGAGANQIVQAAAPQPKVSRPQYTPDVKFGNMIGGPGQHYTNGDSAADAWVRANAQPGTPTFHGAEYDQYIRDLYKKYYNQGADEYTQSGQPTGGLTGSGYLTHQFTPEDFAAGVDPGYAFRFKEGLKAVDRSAAARGGLLGGNQIRGLIDYGQGSASQEYTNAFNRFQTQRSNIYNNLAGIAGIGQTSANTVSNAAGNLGNVLGENYIGQGNARASGYMGSANAISNAIGQGINYYNQNQMLNRAFPQTGATLPNYAGSVTTTNFIP